jgi:hypothetical protein
VTWNFLSSASVHQRIGGAGLFQAALSKMADDHAGQQCDEFGFLSRSERRGVRFGQCELG